MKRFYTSVLVAMVFLSSGYAIGCSSCEEHKGCPCNRPKPPKTRKDVIDTTIDQVEEVSKGCPCNRPPRTRKDQVDTTIDQVEEVTKGCACNNRPKPPRTRKDQIDTAIDQVEEVTKGCACNNRPKPPRTRKDQIDTTIDKIEDDKITAEISAGELIDKITILTIKKENIKDPEKLKNVKAELESLTETKEDLIPPSEEINELQDELLEINKKLWDIEDDIREKENYKDFDQEFVDLARSVYITNDERSIVKRKINIVTGSRLVEEKSYAAY